MSDRHGCGSNTDVARVRRDGLLLPPLALAS